MSKKLVAVLAMALICAWFTDAQAHDLAAWNSQLTTLSPGMTRLEAEKEIEKIRGVKSTYDIWAMDTNAVAAYQLDTETVLVVRYKPGTPAPRTADGRHIPPVDGNVINFDVIRLR